MGTYGLEREGSESPTGKFERQTWAWGERRLEKELLRARERPIKVVSLTTLEKLEKDWERFSPEDKSNTAIRFHRLTGEIMVLNWREMKIEVDEWGRRRLPSSENFQQLRTGKERKVDLENLPRRKVVILEPRISPDIETAIRQAHHVIHERYSEEETIQIDLILRQIERMWQKISRREITFKSRPELIKEAVNFLVALGLPEAKKAEKRKILERILSAYDKDRLGRENYLVKIVKLRSAFLGAMSLEAGTILVREKFSANALLFLMEREPTRGQISEALKVLDTMMGFGKRGAGVFRGLRASKGEPEGMNEVLYEVAKLLGKPRVAPYLATARAAAIAIWGFRPRMVEKNRLIVGEERAKVLLEVESSGFIPVRGLVTQGRFLEARGVTEKWVYSPLKNLLVEADQQMPVSNFHLEGR